MDTTLFALGKLRASSGRLCHFHSDPVSNIDQRRFGTFPII